MREIGQGARFDLAVFAVGFAEEDGGGELRLGTVATYMLTLCRIQSDNASTTFTNYMLTIWSRKYLNPLGTNDFL